MHINILYYIKYIKGFDVLDMFCVCVVYDLNKKSGGALNFSGVLIIHIGYYLSN